MGCKIVLHVSNAHNVLFYEVYQKNEHVIIHQIFVSDNMEALPRSRIISKKLKETALRQHSAKSD